MRIATGVACLALMGTLVSCADLSPMEAGVCGNGVVEPEHGEDCDRFPEGTCRAPGTPGECRIDCSERADGTQPDCPDGWGCGNDGTCRQPSGQFALAAQAEFGAASRLAAGDFDGDGFADVVASNNAGMAVLFSDEDGAMGDRTGVPPSAFPPAVGDLSEDGLDDLALLNSGLMIGRGRSERTLQPTVNAPYLLPNLPARPVLFDARPAEYDAYKNAFLWPGDEMLFFLGVGIFVVEDDAAQIGVLPFSAENIVGDVQHGNLYESETQSPCDEIVVAFKDKPSLWVYTPCRRTADGAFEWNWNGKLPPNVDAVVKLPAVELPAGTTASVVSIADLNGDGHLDLLIGSGNGGAGGGDVPSISQPVVAYGNGTGTFHSNAATLPEAPLHGDGKAEYLNSNFGEVPIAAGDIDGDACADIVTQTAVLVTRPHCATGVTSANEIVYRPVAGAGINTWEYARIADMNGNGIPDVVAGASTLTQLAFFNGAGFGVLNEFGIPLNAPATSLSVGDYDGDLILDIAFREAGPHGEVSEDIETGDALSISYGNGFGAPSAPINMGRLSRILHVQGGNLAAYHPDAIHDIVVVSQSEDESSTSAAVLGGTSDRRLFSPYVFEKDNDDTVYEPIAVVLGQFDGDAEHHLDVAAVTVAAPSDDQPGEPVVAGGDVNLWLVPASEDASLDAAAESVSAPLGTPYEFQYPLVAAVDLGSSGGGADGIDEFVALSSAYDTTTWLPTGKLLVGRVEHVGGKKTFVADAPQNLPLLVFGGVAGLGDSASGGGVATKEEVWSYNGHVVLGDIDRDGALDILVLGLSVDLEAGIWQSTNLMLLRNNGSGSLDAANAVVFPSPDDRNPMAMALLNADADPELEVAVALSDGAYVADFDLEAGVLVNVRPVPEIRGATALLAADLNGDGIDDLAASTLDRVLFFTGAPVIR